MSNHSALKTSGFLVLILLSLFLTNCFEPEEGCLDVNAKDYDIGADKACIDCCTYPDLRLIVAHRYMDSLSFSHNQLYAHAGRTASFLNFKYYLSDIVPITESGQNRNVQDSLFIDSVSVRSDLIRLSPNSSNYDLGSFRYDEALYNGLSIGLGVPVPAMQLEPDSLPSGHPLSWSVDSLYDSASQQYIDVFVEVIPDTSMTDTLQFRAICTKPAIKLLPINQSSTRGLDFELSITVAYDQWIQGIDFKTLDSLQVVERLCDQATDAISAN